MKTKEKILRKIEGMTEDTLGVILEFILKLDKRNPSAEGATGEGAWSALALDSGAFDFWLDSSEVDITPSARRHTRARPPSSEATSWGTSR